MGNKTVEQMIIDILGNRAGFDGWWGQIDEITSLEIIDEIRQVVLGAIVEAEHRTISFYHD